MGTIGIGRRKGKGEMKVRIEKTSEHRRLMGKVEENHAGEQEKVRTAKKVQREDQCARELNHKKLSGVPIQTCLNSVIGYQ